MYQEKCERIQVKYSTVVDNAKNFGNAFIQRLDKEDQEHEIELEEQMFYWFFLVLKGSFIKL